MRAKEVPSNRLGLEEAIDKVLNEMKMQPSDTAEYAKMATQLDKLYKLKEIDAPKHVSLDTLVLVAGNLVGVMIIIGYEHAHVITSKALNMLPKLR